MAERITFQFVGTTTHTLDIDPAEFRGLTVPKIEGALAEILAGIAPDVSFFPDDVSLAAVTIADEAKR